MGAASLLHSLGAVGRPADHLDVGLELEHGAEPVADHRVVVGDEDADHALSAIGDGLGQRQPGGDRRPATGAAHDRQCAAGVARALGHAVEPEAILARRARRGIEADAVVADREDQLLAMRAQLDVDVLGMAVPRGVGERLLADAEQRDLGGGRQRRVRGTARALKRAGMPVRSSQASTSWPIAATSPVAESGAGRRFQTDRRASWSAPRASSRAFSTELRARRSDPRFSSVSAASSSSTMPVSCWARVSWISRARRVRSSSTAWSVSACTGRYMRRESSVVAMNASTTSRMSTGSTVTGKRR